MPTNKITNLIYIIIPVFALHLLEEVLTGFYKTDSSVQKLSEFVNMTPQTTFFLIQILLFTFLAIMLSILLLKKPIPLFLTLILAIISVYEFSHIIESIKTHSYIGGLITGTILFILGILFIFRIFKNHNVTTVN